MNRAKALAGIIVFTGGALVGALASSLVNPAPPASPWRDLPRVEEPAAGAHLATLLVANDAQGLAKTLELQLLQRLAGAIEPLVDVEEVHFTGATERGGDILSSYVAGGRSGDGQRVIVGVVFRVRDGKVIGVN